MQDIKVFLKKKQMQNDAKLNDANDTNFYQKNEKQRLAEYSKNITK